MKNTKSILIVCLLTISSITALSQEYKPVKVGLGMGYAVPAGEGAKGGVLLYLEPAYRLNDKIAVGLRFEVAAMARSVVLSSGGQTISADTEVKANASYSLNGQYYFMDGSFRPFLGVGFGLYTLASQSASVGTTGGGISASASNNKFGFYPRAGFDFGHFTMMFEYNIIPSSSTDVSVTVGNSTSLLTTETKNSYMGIKIGFFIGGGKN